MKKLRDFNKILSFQIMFFWRRHYSRYKKKYGDDSLIYQDLYRGWNIYVPKNLSSPVPLVVDMHGYCSSPEVQRFVSGFKKLAKIEKFIVVWPYGLYKSWNAGKNCCNPANNDEIDDVGFIRKMVEQVSRQYNIDSNRIYATGLSNGAAMSQRLANDASDLFAAVAGFAFYLITPPNPKYQPIPIMEIHGTHDKIVSYQSGRFPGAVENFEKWKEMNRCDLEVTATWHQGKSKMLTAKSSENKTEVSFVTIYKGLHVIYKWFGTKIDTTLIAWNFLKRFSKQKQSQKQ